MKSNVKITHKPSFEVRFRDLSAGDKFVVDNLEFVKLNWDAPHSCRTDSWRDQGLL